MSKQILVTLICKNCNKEFTVPEKEMLRGRKYCSVECTYEGRGWKKLANTKIR